MTDIVMSDEALSGGAAAQKMPQIDDVQWQPQLAPPADVSLVNLRKRGIDVVRISARVPASMRRRLTDALYLAMATALTVFSVLRGEPPVVVAGLVVAWFAFRKTDQKYYSIVVQGNALITADHVGADDPSSPSRLPFEAIQNIVVVNENDPANRALLVIGPSTTRLLCRGISKQSLEWLRSYLLMEIAGLTWKPVSRMGGKVTRRRSNRENDLYQQWTPHSQLPLRLISTFLASSTEQVTALHQARENQDIAAARNAAHWLKSASAAVGATYLSELCQVLELKMRSSDVRDLDRLVQNIDAEYAVVTARLQALVRGDAAPDIIRPGMRSDVAEGDTAQQSGDGKAYDLSLLLVEDSLVNQEVARDLIEPLVREMHIASNGREALDLCEMRRFDVILMDCMMPVLDGFTATRLYRAREAIDDRPRTPIIALTAADLEGDREACIAAGMDDYITKPYGEDQVRAMLERVLRDEFKPAPQERSYLPPEPVEAYDLTKPVKNRR